MALDLRQNSVCFNILRTNIFIETKFCIHIIIDKIFAGIISRHSSQIWNRVSALDLR